MSLEIHSFEFGDFLLDTREKVLLQNGIRLPITPKALELLQILVENHGHLVEREYLLNQVWADSFVEENNLTFTIRLLRKTLGDTKQTPRFIETLPKHGYRFIAKVEEIAAENTSSKNTWLKSKKNLVSIIVVSILLISTIGIGSRYLQSKNREQYAPILNAPFSAEKLSTNGKVRQAVISSDGKNVVYATESGDNKQSVWLRQLETGNNIEIIPPSDDYYFGLALSPDNNFLYFVRGPKLDRQFDLYRVSIFGGIPSRILSQTQGWISLSPDGARISFVRCPYREDENCSLWMADAVDGNNERKLISRSQPFRIGDNQISPDGKRIAFAVGQSETGSNEFGLAEVEIESGTERNLTQEKFFNIWNLTWLPDQSGLLITAARVPNKNFGIWQVLADSGKVELLTKHSESYIALSLDQQASRLISSQVRGDFRLRLWNPENPTSPRFLADATQVTFTPDGRIVFTSSMTGNDEIWLTNADGSGRQQLTNNKADDTFPIVSTDNNLIFFSSNRIGETQIWRMNRDGSNQVQLTQKAGGFPLFASPDGKWLYYHHILQRTLWRVPVSGGEEQIVFDKRKDSFALSPDGAQLAFSEISGEEKLLMVVSLNEKQGSRTFKLADQKSVLTELAWMPDGKRIIYVLRGPEEKNTLWLQILNGGTPQKIADLVHERVPGRGLAVSPDGKVFAIVQGGWQHDAVLIKGLR